MRKNYSVYLLICLETREVFYVGVTTNMYSRYYTHHAATGLSKVYRIIRQLVNDGQHFGMEIVAKGLKINTAHLMERELIRAYKTRGNESQGVLPVIVTGRDGIECIFASAAEAAQALVISEATVVSRCSIPNKPFMGLKFRHPQTVDEIKHLEN